MLLRDLKFINVSLTITIKSAYTFTNKTIQLPIETTAQKMKFSIKDFFSKCD